MKKTVLAALSAVTLLWVPIYSSVADVGVEHNSTRIECGGGCEDSCTSMFPNARIEVGYAIGKWIGIRRNYAELGVFLPVAFSPNWVSFADARGYRFNHSRWGASAGIGVRIAPTNQRIYGGNIYYDYLESHSHKGFHRLGAGLEWLGDCWDLRLNGYFRLGAGVHDTKPHVFDNYIGNYIVICQAKEYSISEGFDAEVGIPLLSRCDLQFYAALGPYYYRGSHSHSDNFWGGHARLELSWKSFISIQVRTSYDRRNHSRTQGRLWISIPFDFFKCSDFSDFCNLLTQPVQRNGIIFTDKCCHYHTNY
jgi:hypothetical protein